MIKNFKKATTLIETLVTISILAVMVSVSVPFIMPLLKDFDIRDNTLRTVSMINNARSQSIKLSETVCIDFSQATTNHGEQGGLIKIVKDDGTIISDMYLEKNILLNPSLSTIENKKIYFDYKGRPIDEAGSYLSFNTSNNKVSLGFYKPNSGYVINKSVTITPLTGKLVEN